MNLFLIGEQTPDNGNFLFSGKGQETGSKHVDDDECQVLLLIMSRMIYLIPSGHMIKIHTLATTTINWQYKNVD
jgi:hypothetical protein